MKLGIAFVIGESKRMIGRNLLWGAVLALSCSLVACGGGGGGGGSSSGGVTPPVNPSGGTFHLFTAPETDGNIVLGSDGSFYYPAWNPSSQGHSEIVRFTPQQAARSYKIPRSRILHNAAIIPTDVALGLDGNVWFGTYDCMIGSVTPSGTFKEFVLNATGLCSTTVGSSTHGTGLWFTQALGGVNNYVGYITAGGIVTRFPIADTGSLAPGQIVLGPDGNFWFTDGDRIGKVTAAGNVSYYATNPDMETTSIIVGPDKNLWYSGNSTNEQVGTMTTSGKVVAEFAPGGQIFFLTAGADGNVWGSNSPTAGLLRITPSGSMKIFYIHHDKVATPRGVVVGPDSNIWFDTFGNDDTVGMGNFVQN